MAFKTKDTLLAYIPKIEEKANELLRYFLFQVVPFSPTLRATDFMQNQDTLRTGVVVWTKFLNDFNISDTDRLFFEMKNGSDNGRDGAKFLSLLLDKKAIITSKQQSSQISLDVFKSIKNVAIDVIPGAGTILALANYLEGNSKQETDIAVTTKALQLTTDMLFLFYEFISEYVKEYKNQFSEYPEIYYLLKLDQVETTEPTEPIEPTNPTVPTAKPPVNPVSQNNNSSLLGNTSNSNIILYFFLFLLLILFLKRNKSKTRKRK
jgi:hypothetical protein